MADLIQCDGGCGKVSPDPVTRLHVANAWLMIEIKRAARRDVHAERKYIYCEECAPRILAAMEPTREDGSSQIPTPAVRKVFLIETPAAVLLILAGMTFSLFWSAFFP